MDREGVHTLRFSAATETLTFASSGSATFFVDSCDWQGRMQTSVVNVSATELQQWMPMHNACLTNWEHSHACGLVRLLWSRSTDTLPRLQRTPLLVGVLETANVPPC